MGRLMYNVVDKDGVYSFQNAPVCFMILVDLLMKNYRSAPDVSAAIFNKAGVL